MPKKYLDIDGLNTYNNEINKKINSIKQFLNFKGEIPDEYLYSVSDFKGTKFISTMNLEAGIYNLSTYSIYGFEDDEDWYRFYPANGIIYIFEDYNKLKNGEVFGFLEYYDTSLAGIRVMILTKNINDEFGVNVTTSNSTKLEPLFKNKDAIIEGKYNFNGNISFNGKATLSIMPTEDNELVNKKYVDDVTSGGSNIQEIIEQAILESDKRKYPIGSILMSTSNVNPNTYLNFGTWELWGSGKVPIGVDSTNTNLNASEKIIGTTNVSIDHTHSVNGQTITSDGTTLTTNAATGNTDSTTPGATGAATGNTGSTTLTINQIPSHTHNIYMDQNGTSNYWGPNGTVQQSGARYSNSGSAGGGQGHTHTLNNHTHTSAAHRHGLGSHKHSIASHTHNVKVASSTTGASSITSISTYQPSIACYMWKRIA